MAFLLPENIVSRSGVPSRLRQVARAFRDFTSDDVVVWLREPMSQVSYLVILDPSAGIMVVDAPPLPARRTNRLGRIFNSLEMISIHDEIIKSSDILKDGLAATAIERLDVKCVLAAPDLDEVPSEAIARATPPLEILTRSDLAQNRLNDAISRIFGDRAVPPLSRPEQDLARAVVNPEIILPQSGIEHLPLFQDPEIAPEEMVKVMDREQEARGGASRLRISGSAWRGWQRQDVGASASSPPFAPSLAAMADSRAVLQPCSRKRSDRDGGLQRESDGDQRRPPGVQVGQERTEIAASPISIQLVEKATQAAAKLPDSELYDVVLVDEAQDFDHARLDLAYAMLKSDRRKPDPQKPDSDNFVTALDAAQNVYRRGGAKWNPPGSDAQGRARTARGRTTLFRKNYRNTREILEFAMTFLAGSSDWADASVDIEDPSALVPPEAAKRGGPPPKVVECSDLRAEADEIAAATQRLIDDGVSVAEIVVMYGHKDLEKHLYRSFSQRDLPYFHVLRRQDGQDGRDKAPSVRDAVRVSTLTSMKGLEFSRVFVGAVNSVEVPDVDEEEQFLAAKSQIYAAMTRAMDELVITVSGDGQIGRALRAARSGR